MWKAKAGTLYRHWRGKLRSWWKPVYWWTVLAISLCPIAEFLPYHFLKTEHHVPVGIYIAIMGGLAAAVTFRKDPPVGEKAAWIALIALLIVAEIRNLYVTDQEQAMTFSSINGELKETKKGLDQTVEHLTTIQGHVDVGVVSSQRAADTATEAVRSITGGNSWGWVEVLPLHILNAEPSKPLLGITNNSDKYAMRSVHLIIVNTSLLISGGAAVQMCDVGDVPPRMKGMPLPSCTIMADPKIHNSIFITINANNGSVQESLQLDYRLGHWENGGTVRRGKPNGTSEELMKFGAKQP